MIYVLRTGLYNPIENTLDREHILTSDKWHTCCAQACIIDIKIEPGVCGTTLSRYIFVCLCLCLCPFLCLCLCAGMCFLCVFVRVRVSVYVRGECQVCVCLSHTLHLSKNLKQRSERGFFLSFFLFCLPPGLRKGNFCRLSEVFSLSFLTQEFEEE